MEKSFEYYDMYLNTYSDCNIDNIWEAILTACELFRIIAIQVSEKLDFIYNIEDDKNMMEYINNIKKVVTLN